MLQPLYTKLLIETVLHYCEFSEPVTCCVFIFALCNISLGGYLDTRRNT